MPLPDFDNTKHHIGIRPTGVGNYKGYILTGGYRVDPQKYGTSSEFGGQADQIEQSALDRWTQDDWSGGVFQDNFDNDPAMFADSQNFLPALIEKTARTVPPLVYFASGGHIDAVSSLVVASTGGKRIAIVDSDRIRTINAETGAFLEAFDPTRTIYAAQHDPADNTMYCMVRKVSDGTPQLVKLKSDISGFDLIKEAGATMPEVPAGMAVTSGRDILTAQGTPGQTLYLWDVNDDRNDATITRIGRLPGKWKDSVTYNGLTYILLTDGEQLTQVVAWDGTQILPVTEFPYNFLGKTICSYGGRLYVGGSASDIAGNARFAELYEITGASLRLVKTWIMEARAGQTVPRQIFDMAVHEGFLWLATDRTYLVAYDLTRDALWNRITIEPKSSDPGHSAHEMHAMFLLSTREKLVAWCKDATDGAAKGFYRIASVDADLTSFTPDVTYDSVIETSDFMPEPDREKRWSSLRVLSRYAPDATMQYSQDGGTNWTTVAAEAAGSGDLRTYDFDLSGATISESIRFKFTFPKTTVAYTEMIAMTLTFLMLDTGKMSWAFTIAGVDNPEETTTDAYPALDIATLRTTLRSFWTDRTTLDFTDVDGVVYKVYMSSMTESQPFIDASAALEREAFWSVTLTEI